jgi:UDP-N-acetylmuramoylalanine--D-glutamate ligase
MKIAILGYGTQGQSAYEYWRKGNDITICDATVIESPGNVELISGPDYLKNLDQYDLIVRSPSIHPRDIVAANDETISQKVTTVTNEFMRVCPSKNVIGVTGTKGKGTTSTLITKMLEAAGKKVHLGGNIGIPPLELLKNDIQPDDWVVLELANFQLIDLQYSPHIAVGVMVVPEHLNWHADFDEYVASKQNLFKYQTVHDLAVYNRNNVHSEQLASVSPAPKLSYEVPSPGADPRELSGAYVKDDVVFVNNTKVCTTSEPALLGRHNLENICAACLAVWDIVEGDITALREVITTFSGLEHRLEFVRELNGVRYYDDSFGTTPETSIVAMQAFQGPKVMILGGSDKGVPFDDLAQVAATSNVKHAIVIGDVADNIVQALHNAGFESITTGLRTMRDIVVAAQQQATPGDTVLLSTGTASFGLFNDYKDRGDQFKHAVQALV